MLTLLIPPSAQLGDGTIEEVTLSYDPAESDRVRDALVEKYGTSHPPEKKISRSQAEVLELFGVKTRDFWKTGWGELLLIVAKDDAFVIAKTQKLISFEQANKKDEF